MQRSDKRSVGWGRGGFTLTEVVLALAIVSGSLAVVLGMFSGIVNNSKRSLDRQEVLQASRAVTLYLQEIGFDAVYGWMNGGAERELYAYTYRAGDAGGPILATDAEAVPGKSYVLRTLVQDLEDPNYRDYEDARVGQFYVTRVALSPSNPEALGSGPSDYPAGYLLVRVKMFAVPDKAALISEKRTPDIEFDVAVRR